MKKPTAADRTVDMAVPARVKPVSSSDRTIDMFTGSTNVEAATQSDVQQEEKAGDPSIEANMDRYRQTAFEYQEYFSKNWPEPHNKEVFRLTSNDTHFFLEKKEHGTGEAFSWTGVMFKKSSLFEATSVFVAAARAEKAKEKSGEHA